MSATPAAQAPRPGGDTFVDYLVAAGKLSAGNADVARRVEQETGDSIAGVLRKLGQLSEMDLASAMAQYGNCTLLSELRIEAIPELGDRLTAKYLLDHEVIPLRVSGEHLEVACWNLLDDFALRGVTYATGLPVRAVVAPFGVVIAALRQFYPAEALSPSISPADESAGESQLDALKDLASDAPVIRLVQRVINQAIAMRASDIHFEPVESGLLVRFRSDGLLREIERCPASLAAPIVSRIKIMAGLNIAEKRLPQDGRIRTSIQGKEIDFRVATSPTLLGESVVLRVLDRQDVALDFDALGFDEALKSQLREAVMRPHGIVLVTGPTGSGKTTTLYAALKTINTPDKKILTIEDPVEYLLEGVNQVPVKPQIGLTFAHALRAFLRQDPDIMMVGEIRDRETADIAIQAALTGHLLLSTLHTNTAAAALTRLLDMGIDDYLLTSTLHLILGQRLVRRLCGTCRVPWTAGPEVLKRFALSADSEEWFRAAGCADCGGTGYRGRTTIIEALPLSEAIRKLVLSRADAHELESAARREGMRTMLEHGLERVRAGLTSAEEVLRVTALA